MREFLKIAALALLVWYAASHLMKKDSWVAIYYPDASNLYEDERSGPLDSLDDCRSWVQSQRSIRRFKGGDDYECGKNCEYDAGADLHVCEETIK